MANLNGNVYPFLIISERFQIYGIDDSYVPHLLTTNSLNAVDIGISEDGTIWVLSNEPDPDGGGAKLYWGTGDGNWNEIDTQDPGGAKISGGSGSSCFYLTYEGEILSMDTNGSSTVFDNNPDHNYVDFDYGGGYMWAIVSLTPGTIPKLCYSEVSNLDWKPFEGNEFIYSISVNHMGNCAGIDNQYNPMIYTTDGSKSFSAGAGVNGQAIQISAKNWRYVLTMNATMQGNRVYVWEDIQGGKFTECSIMAHKVLGTYNRKKLNE